MCRGVTNEAKTVSFRDIYKEWEKLGIYKIPENKREVYQQVIGNVGAYTSIKGYDAITFDGALEIKEEQSTVPILGRLSNGTKSIRATLMLCDNLHNINSKEYETISSVKVYEAQASVEVGHDTVPYKFSGLKFIDSDPINNTITFEVTDLYLIEKLLKHS